MVILLFENAAVLTHMQDWKRLCSNIAPTLMVGFPGSTALELESNKALLKPLQVDYTGIGLQKWAGMPADEYMAMVQHPSFLGDPCTMTQHLVGATYYEKISDTETIGRHQIRAAHQVYAAPDLKKVKFKGHAHASNIHYYRKIDGVWKLAGIKPTVLWSEYDFWSVWNRTPARQGGIPAYLKTLVATAWRVMTAGSSILGVGRTSEDRIDSH